MNYLDRSGGTRQTPQRQRIPGRSDQVENSAGGYVWESDPWQRLARFLILGSEGGSYYASERQLTTENIACIHECLTDNGPLLVMAVIGASVQGRAPSNDPALYALAVAISHGDRETKIAAGRALPEVARTGTHLYHFIRYAEGMRGWGTLLRRAVGEWYNTKPIEKLAYDAIKYRQRDGWSHRDLLRLAHPKGDAEHNLIYNWITHGNDPSKVEYHGSDLIAAHIQAMHESTTPQQAAQLVRDFRLPREALKSEHLTDPLVWRAMLEMGMPVGALVRNLANMTRIGVFEDRDYLNLVEAALTNPEQLRKSRIHPIAILLGLGTYAQGHGFRGSNIWKPLPRIIDALDHGFYGAFANVEPSGKNTLIAIDVSGSMTAQVGHYGMSARVLAGALAMVTLSVEPDCQVIAISDNAYSTAMSKRQRLDDVTKMLNAYPAGRTDLSLLAQVAHQNIAERFETLILLTDNETWAGSVHPSQAVQHYRERSGIAARSIAVAMTANRWSIHDPNDTLSLDVVGFDASTPQLMAEFAAGRV